MIEAPPRTPRSDDPEALIPEARARQRKRWLVAAAAVALLAGAALGIDSIVGAGSPTASSSGVPIPAAATGKGCGVRGVGVRILSTNGQTLYREPGHFVHPNGGPFPTIRCSGSTVWAVWMNGAGMSQEAYFGARSLDRGRTWRAVFTERFFGLKAPHELDAYMGPWTLRGTVAYFVGWCPACSQGTLSGTTSLWVTKDGGRTFDKYDVPGGLGYYPTSVRVAGRRVTISEKRFSRGVKPARKTASVTVS
jgi:hypothetical protein